MAAWCKEAQNRHPGSKGAYRKEESKKNHVAKKRRLAAPLVFRLAAYYGLPGGRACRRSGVGLHHRRGLRSGDRKLGQHRLGGLRLADVVVREAGARRDEAADDYV